MSKDVLTADRITELRDRRYRRLPALRLRDERDATVFINDVGVCLLFSAKGIELPTLWAAICGEDRTVPRRHDDYELNLAWEWKDTIPIRGEALYGKFLRGRPVFISLDLAPAFYALSENYGELDDYLLAYQDGHMSEEAKRVYEALLEEGPMPTSELRRKAGISGREAAGLFDRALTELQMGFRIAKVGIADTNRWKYCYVYDLFLRRYPQLAKAARELSQDQAAGLLLKRYLHTVVVADPQRTGRLFGWSPWRLERTLRQLEECGLIQLGVHVDGFSGEQIILSASEGA